MTKMEVRHRAFSYFSDDEPESLGGTQRWLMCAHNFSVEWVDLADDLQSATFDSGHESILLVEGPGARIQSQTAGSPAVNVPGRTVAITPPGNYRITAPQGAGGTRLALITARRSDLLGRRPLSPEICEPRDPRVLPAGVPYRRRQDAGGILVYALDEIKASPEKPRLKMLQTDTLSVNLVEYEGPRTRSELSPHSHSSFEQGSLALAGDFVHHLRVPWGADANQWREDEHLPAGSPSLLVVPVEMIHTTEGVGPGRHFLIDVFSPPRKDFIAKGWVFNAADYTEA